MIFERNHRQHDDICGRALNRRVNSCSSPLCTVHAHIARRISGPTIGTLKATDQLMDGLSPRDSCDGEAGGPCSEGAVASLHENHLFTPKPGPLNQGMTRQLIIGRLPSKVETKCSSAARAIVSACQRLTAGRPPYHASTVA